MQETTDEFGDRTGLKEALETHLEYGDDFVRLALISFKQHIKELEKQNEKLITFAIDYYLILGFMGNTENIRIMLSHEIEQIKQKPIEEILKEV